MSKMDEKEAKKLSMELMESSKAVYLTTIDSKGYPITRAMFNLRNKEQFPELSKFFSELDNKFEIYISTNTASSKTEHIKKNPKISVYFCVYLWLTFLLWFLSKPAFLQTAIRLFGNSVFDLAVFKEGAYNSIQITRNCF